MHEIVVLIVSLPKRVKVLVAQVWFADSDLRRDYSIFHKAPANRNSKGFWQVSSWTDAELRRACLPEQFDLRHTSPTLLGEDDEGRQAWVAGWEEVEGDLLAADLELVFGGCEKHPLP
jgi:hypothetical protein